MAILELSDTQLAVLKAGWNKLMTLIGEDTEISDDIADDLGMDAEARGLEDEDGEELSDYDEGDDPVFKGIGEVKLLINAAK
jgi:hypothetical protein